jgi:HprK-related kinase B
MSPQALLAPVATLHELALSFVDVTLRVRTNDPEVRAALAVYYRRWVVADPSAALAEVRLIQGTPPAGGEFTDLKRPDGRKAKEATRDVGDGRLILKRTTGVLMGLWTGGAFAVGDLRGNLNQAINLINNCYAKAVLKRGHLLLHASAVSHAGRTAVLAGPPGAGKSTAALHLVEAGFRCLSNDRVLAKALGDHVEILGYPKQPRVNPGTLLGHPRLSALLAPEERAALASLPPDALWELERKSDVDLDAIYGEGTVELRGRMRALVLLKWRRGGEGLRVRRLAPAEALADLRLFYKNLGAFDLDRPAQAPATPDERARYAELLARVEVVEVTGRPDFEALVSLVGDVLDAAPAPREASRR